MSVPWRFAAGAFSFDAAETFSPEEAAMILGFDGPEVTSSRLERWSPPTNFAKRYASELRRARSLRVLLGGHAIHIQAKASGGYFDHVLTAAQPGREFRVCARFYSGSWRPGKSPIAAVFQRYT